MEPQRNLSWRCPSLHSSCSPCVPHARWPLHAPRKSCWPGDLLGGWCCTGLAAPRGTQCFRAWDSRSFPVLQAARLQSGGGSGDRSWWSGSTVPSCREAVIRCACSWGQDCRSQLPWESPLSAEGFLLQTLLAGYLREALAIAPLPYYKCELKQNR